MMMDKGVRKARKGDEMRAENVRDRPAMSLDGQVTNGLLLIERPKLSGTRPPA